jgi:kynurenine formamidase
VDAPAHFLVHGASIDAMPLEPFYGPACVLRIPSKAGARIYADELTAFDGLIVPGARILIETGWSSHWGVDDYFKEPPVLTPDSVMLLASRGLALLGIDGPDISSNEKLAHEMLLGKGVALLENLAHLDECPDAFHLCALPLKLDGCDGSPVRAVAIVE